MKYRIKKYYSTFTEQWLYVPQRRVLFIWWSQGLYPELFKAKAFIDEQVKKKGLNKKDLQTEFIPYPLIK